MQARERTRRMQLGSRRIRKLSKTRMSRRGVDLTELFTALKAHGLAPDEVFKRRRWDKSDLDVGAINAALYGLTLVGWSAERLAEAMERSVEVIDRHILAHRHELNRRQTEPIYNLRKLVTTGQSTLTLGEVGALDTFTIAHSKFHAAIGSSAYTTAAAGGAPMSEEAIEAVEAEYKRLCALVIRKAGDRCLSAVQGLAMGLHGSNEYMLRAAARAIDPSLGAIHDPEGVAVRGGAA